MHGCSLMALPMTLVAGMLIFSGVQASDIAGGSVNYGFLSTYMPLRSESSKNFVGDHGKFMAHHLNHMERGGRSEASLDQDDPAEDTTGGSSYPDLNWDNVGIIAMPIVD